VPSFNRQNNKKTSTITKILDELWGKISDIFPKEKPRHTVGRPIIPFRKVLDGILYVLRTGCQWKIIPKEFGSGSLAIGDFNNGFRRIFLKRYG
jgi:transposase